MERLGRWGAVFCALAMLVTMSALGPASDRGRSHDAGVVAAGRAPSPECIPPPAGMTSWWPGDGNAADIVDGNGGTPVGGVTYAPGRVGQAFRLNGADGWVNLGAGANLNFGTGDFTVDLWVNFDALTGERVLIEKWVQSFNDTRPSTGWTLTKLDSNVVRLATAGTSQGEGNIDVTPPGGLSPNTWYFVAVTRRSGTATVYWNATAVGSKALSANLNSTASLKLGHRGNPGDTPGSEDTRGFYLDGRIDEVEVFGRALTAAEVQAIFGAGAAGKCKLPHADAGGPYVTDEGSPLTLNASRSADPKGHALAFRWDFLNDGTWDTGWSSSPFAVYTYGHEWAGQAHVEVGDGTFTDNATANVTVLNAAPTVHAGPDPTIPEGSAANVAFTFTDPGFDMPNAGLYENFTATVDWGYAKWPAESAGVVKVPGGPGVPTTGFVNLSKVYGDNGFFTVTVTVCDDGGGCGNASLLVTVNNVAPGILDLRARALANVTLRVAGERWHDMTLEVVGPAGALGTASVTRVPGSPDDRRATVEGGPFDFLSANVSLVVRYTPSDDPVNGQPNGANPAWVILTFEDGSEVWLHHTLNVRQEETWVWTVSDLRPYLVGKTITFEATAHDVGSDDLTFTWSFGDGTPDTSAVYFNDGVGPDPYLSPEVNPVTATGSVAHTFPAAGTYTVTLTVTDDDGGTATWALVVTVGT